MCPLLSVRFYSLHLYSVFNEHFLSRVSPLKAFCDSLSLVGTSGLEPPTSRLSGARSNHLSYAPSWLLAASSFHQCLLVEMMGFEPMTPCLQGRCSPNWATPPLIWGFSFFSVTENWTTSRSVLRCTTIHLVIWPISDTIHSWKCIRVSIERRWSSRTFRYGYLVTT